MGRRLQCQLHWSCSILGLGALPAPPLFHPLGRLRAGRAATYTQRQSHHADNLSSEHRPDENAFLARVWAVAASSRDSRLHVPACRECRGGSIARRAALGRRAGATNLETPQHSPDPPQLQEIVPSWTHQMRNCLNEETTVKSVRK